MRVNPRTALSQNPGQSGPGSDQDHSLLSGTFIFDVLKKRGFLIGQDYLSLKMISEISQVSLLREISNLRNISSKISLFQENLKF